MRKTLFLTAALMGVIVAVTLLSNSSPAPTVVRTAPADVIVPATGFQPDHVFATLPTTTTTLPKPVVVAPKPPAVVHRPVAVVAPKVATRPVYRAPVRVYRAAAPLSLSATWQCIVRAESGGNPRAYNASSGASGILQFLRSTWFGVTGLPGDAANYPVSVQMAAGYKLQARSGWSQWSSHSLCGV